MNATPHATQKTVGIGWVQAIVAAALRGGAEQSALLTLAGMATLPQDPLALDQQVRQVVRDEVPEGTHGLLGPVLHRIDRQPRAKGRRTLR